MATSSATELDRDSARYARTSELTPVRELEAARAVRSPGARQRALRRGAEELRERFADSPRVVSVRTFPVTTFAYPTKYAFWGAAYSPAPYVVLTHRALLVQFLQRGEIKTLLFNPTDEIAARATPFFAHMVEQMGDYFAFRLLATHARRLEEQLAHHGLTPASIDYVAFDHFHMQDLRPLLGTDDGEYAARFPRAKLLAQRSEWEDWDDLHPMQRAWYVPDGKRGVVTGRVALIEGDLELGDGVLLVSTPGHTSGNQTLFINTPDGVWGCSNNGVCADSWSPLESRIKGLAAMCRRQDLDLVLNANTPELGAEQYTSMCLERTMVDRLSRAPGFCQIFPSSEITPSALAPGLKPTLLYRRIEYGEVVRADALRPASERSAAVAAQ